MTCRPKTASGFVSWNRPSSSISLAPQLLPVDGANRLEPSSAGWKMNTTVPGRSSFKPASTSAVAMSMAVCASCPQACMTPTSFPPSWALAREAKGSPSGSSTGSASMSARRATVRPGLAPFRMPTTPVRATPVRTSSPRPRKCSATRREVRVSWSPSSGCWWMSLRQAISFSSTAVARFRTSASRAALSARPSHATAMNDIRARAMDVESRAQLISAPLVPEHASGSIRVGPGRLQQVFVEGQHLT